MFSWVPSIKSAKRLQKKEDKKCFKATKAKIRKAIEETMRKGLYEYCSFPSFSIWGDYRKKIIKQLRAKGYAVGERRSRDFRDTVIAWGEEKENVREEKEDEED
jgi:hypothetical protein